MLKVVKFNTVIRQFLNISVASFGVSLSKLDFVILNTFYSNSYSFHPSDQIRVSPSVVDASQKLFDITYSSTNISSKFIYLP